MFELMNLRAFWDSAAGNPFLDTCFPVETDQPLTDLIRDEVLRRDPTKGEIDFVRDIKSAQTASGKDVLRCLEQPVSAFFIMSTDDNPKTLTVVIDKPFAAAGTKVSSGYDKMMATMKPTYSNFKSEWSVEEVEKFLSGYEEATNKGNYLSTFTREQKPSIKQQIEAFLVQFLNDNGIRYKGGTGGEDKRATDGLKRVIEVVHFVHDRRNTLGMRQALKYKSCPILEAVQNCVAVKACKGSKARLTRTMLSNELASARAALSAFPKSWYRVNQEGERFSEAIFREIEAMIDIVGSYLDLLVKQDGWNQDARQRETTAAPSAANTSTYVVKGSMVPRPLKSTHHKSLRDQMKAADVYQLFHLTDATMGIVSGTKSPNQRSKERAKFLANILFQFPVGVYKFGRYGSLGHWVVVCRLERGDCERSKGFQGFVVEATRRAPALLSKRQTKDAVNCIALASGKSKHVSKALLMAILPDCTLPTFSDDMNEREFLRDTAKLIRQADGDDELEMITDMRMWNGKSDTGSFDLFWEAAGRVLEEENGSGAHSRRHAAGDDTTTNTVSYAPGIVSIPQLRRAVIDKLTKDGVVFDAPCLSWLYLQLSPNNEHKQTAERYTGKLPFKMMLQTKDARAEHPAGHYVSAAKKYWRFDAARLYSLFDDYYTSSNDSECHASGICSIIGRTPRTPNVSVNGCNLRDEVLRFMTFPVPNPDDPDHYLQPADAREHIESKNLTVEDLRAFMPSERKSKQKRGNEQTKEMSELRKLYKPFDFNATKVRAIASCASCGAVRAVYSKYAVGLRKESPTETDLENLHRVLENKGYTCGSKIKGGGKYFYSRRAIRCGSHIEASYYNPSTGTKGGRIVTSDICAVCYVDDDLVPPNEIRKARSDLGGKTPLTVCRDCLDSPGVDVPFSGKRVNFAQARKQGKEKKKRQLDEAVKSGRKKRSSAK